MDPGKLALRIMGAPSIPASLLVVDDEPLLGDLMRNVLEGVGHRVRLACDGRQGLDYYRQAMEEGQPYDLVMMDLNMPVMDGRQCLEELWGLNPQARVIITTGEICDDLESWADRAAGVLHKPCSIITLVEEVNRALGRGLPC